MTKSGEAVSKGVNLRYSVGLVTDAEGHISDVMANGPAAKAGLAPGTQVIAVNGRQFSKASARAEIKAAKNTTVPLEFLVKDGEYYKTYRVDCHTGDLYPNLERDASKPDLLTQIVSARK